MCGVCGEIRFDGKPADTGAVSRMTASMASRAPDSGGMYVQESIAFLVTRGFSPFRIPSRFRLETNFNRLTLYVTCV